MSSNPVMMRSSRGDLPLAFSGASNSASSAARSSRSRSLIVAALLAVTHEGGCALGKSALPCVGGCGRRRPAPLLLEAHGTDGVLLRLFGRQCRALCRDRSSHLLKAFL